MTRREIHTELIDLHNAREVVEKRLKRLKSLIGKAGAREKELEGEIFQCETAIKDLNRLESELRFML